MVSRAEKAARRAHEGQVDKGGEAYIEHVERVAQRLVRFSPEVVAVAWLHATCERGDLHLTELDSLGFDSETLVAVKALTKGLDEDAASYLNRVLTTRTSATVKRADLTDNTRQERLAKVLDTELRRKLELKYDWYLSVLGSFSNVTLEDLLDGAVDIAWEKDDSCDPLAVYHDHPLRLAQAALEQVRDAITAEPGITRTLDSRVPPAGRLDGRSQRLKSPAHLAKKLRVNAKGVGIAVVHDQLRYTLVLPLSELVELANGFFEDLRSRGWRCLELTHRYHAGSAYKGIHALLLSHGASSRVVELQIDSEESLRAKSHSRPYYEMRRLPRGSKGRLSDNEINEHRIRISDAVPTPPGLADLQFGDMYIKPIADR